MLILFIVTQRTKNKNKKRTRETASQKALFKTRNLYANEQKRLQNTQWFEVQQIDIHSTSPHENIGAIQFIIPINSKIISGSVTVRRPFNSKWISPGFIVLRINLTALILTL